MSEVTIIGIDLAKRVFQLHGAFQDGSVAFRKKLSRGQLLAFVARHPKCVIAMEASAAAHGRDLLPENWTDLSWNFPIMIP
jgi:transposase